MLGGHAHLPLNTICRGCVGVTALLSTLVVGIGVAVSASALGTCLLWPCCYPSDYLGLFDLRSGSPRHSTTTGTVFCMAVAYSVTAGLDALWTPSCRFTSECRGLSSHPAVIRLYSIFFVFALFLVSHLRPTAIS